MILVGRSADALREQHKLESSSRARSKPHSRVNLPERAARLDGCAQCPLLLPRAHENRNIHGLRAQVSGRDLDTIHAGFHAAEMIGRATCAMMAPRLCGSLALHTAGRRTAAVCN